MLRPATNESSPKVGFSAGTKPTDARTTTTQKIRKLTGSFQTLPYRPLLRRLLPRPLLLRQLLQRRMLPRPPLHPRQQLMPWPWRPTLRARSNPSPKALSSVGTKPTAEPTTSTSSISARSGRCPLPLLLHRRTRTRRRHQRRRLQRRCRKVPTTRQLPPRATISCSPRDGSRATTPPTAVTSFSTS